MNVPVKMVLVKKTGKRYLYNGEHRDIVVCKGDVQWVQGFSLTHGPDKKFKRDTVNVLEVDLTEQLAQELYSESEDKRPPPPPVPKERKGPAWVKWFTDYDGKKRAQLTKHADKELVAQGFDMAYDQLGHGWGEEMLPDAASDSAAYCYELTAEGVREGYMVPVREAAADMIYEGMLKALEKCQKEGRKLE